MAFSDFLADQIDGYLLEDLNSMMAVRLQEGKTAGGVGYPIVMTVFAGIELLGAFVEAADDPLSTFNKHPGPLYFKTYWTRMLYPASPRKDAGLILFRLVRHGLMHSFTTKGPDILVSKGQERRDFHLREWADGKVEMNCDQLVMDFRDSYLNRFKPLADQNVARMDVRLEDIAQQYADQAKELRDLRLPKVSPVGPPSPTPATPPTSPSGSNLQVTPLTPSISSSLASQTTIFYTPTPKKP